MVDVPVSEDDSDNPESTSPSSKHIWVRSDVIAAVAAVAAVVLAIVAIVTLINSYGNGEPEGVVPSPGTASAHPPSSPGIDPASSVSEAEEPISSPDRTMDAVPLKAGCRLSGSPTSCQAEHNAEIAAIEPCTQEGLIIFMGGSPRVEILNDELKLELREGACVISGIKPQTKQSLSGILGERAGDAYRKCLSTDTDTEVGCDVPHSDEQIFKGGSEDVACEQYFADYVGKEFGAFARQLELQLRPGPTTECWITLRVSNRLIASVRNLKDRPLPLQDE